jgi:DNA-binding MarR family transcriptional regulator
LKPRESLTDEIVDAMAAVYATLQELKAPTWLRLDLTMAQFRALVVVNHRRGITVGELGCQLSIGQSAASLLTEHLVRRGLVGRTEDPADRRRALLGCTAAGEELIAELRHLSRQTLKQWLALLSDEDLAGMARGLQLLSQTARAAARGGETITDEVAS